LSHYDCQKSSIARKKDHAGAPIVPERPFNAGAEQENGSRIHGWGRCGCIDIAAAAAEGRFDIIPKA